MQIIITVSLAAGVVPSPFDCYLVTRSLRTLKVRMKEHMASGLRVACFLESHPAVEQVLYPGKNVFVVSSSECGRIKAQLRALQYNMYGSLLHIDEIDATRRDAR